MDGAEMNSMEVKYLDYVARLQEILLKHTVQDCAVCLNYIKC